MIAIVQQDIDSRQLEFRVERLGHRQRLRFGHVDHAEDHFVRSDRQRPDQSVLIVLRFGQTRDDAVHADTVAAHDDRLANSLFILEQCPERRTVFRAELEDVADFDAVHQFQRSFTARTRIAADGVAQVVRRVERVVRADVHVHEVLVFLVRAGDGVDEQRHVVVSDDGAFDADRAGKSDGCSRHLQDRRGIGQFQRGGSQCAANLAFIGRVVASHQHGDRLAVGDVDQRLDHLLRLALQQLADRFDAADLRRVDLRDRLRVG